MAEKSERSTSEQLPEDVGVALVVRGIEARDEVTLRQALEKHLKGYTLYRLTPAAARRWVSADKRLPVRFLSTVVMRRMCHNEYCSTTEESCQWSWRTSCEPLFYRCALGACR